MKTAKKIAIGLFIVFVGIQFIRPASNKDSRILATDFNNTLEVPPGITVLLRRSCYDCHSNNTKYPWYSQIQPMGWILSKHISEGKKELNFSEFGAYPARKQSSKMKAIKYQITQNKMPLPSYTLIHKEAKLTTEEKHLIITFLNKLSL
jgi:hypothetical protein